MRHSLFLLRRDLPVVGASLAGHGSGGTRRSELRNDLVDMPAAIADHKHYIYDPGRTRRDRRVQVDHHAARAVAIDRVGAGFLPFRCEIGLAPRSKAVARVITLREIALAVENLDAGPNTWWTIRKTWWSVRGKAERVFTLSVASEQPKSSARATPLSAGNTIAAASISFQSQLFIFALPSLAFRGTPRARYGEGAL